VLGLHHVKPAVGLTAARVPRDRHALGADHRARGGGLHPVSLRGAAWIVARAAALPPAVRRGTGRSPRPARSTPGGASSRRPGTTPVPVSAGRCTSARRDCPTTCCRSPRAPSTASTGSTSECGSAKSGNVITVAAARELACFLWAAASPP
jgi:hypothetical protein